MKETIYFQHDCDARNDAKIIKLRMQYGRDGYGLWRATLEIMRSDANVMLSQCDVNANAFQLQYDVEKYNEFLSFCVEIGLFMFDEQEKVYYSPRLQENVEFMRSKSKKARSSANTRWEARSNANALPTQYESNAKKRKDNTIQENKIQENFPSPEKTKLPKEKFVVPTVAEVRAYCTERKNTISPEQFCNFYETKGRKVGKEKMASWQACIRTWENREKEKLKSNHPNIDLIAENEKKMKEKLALVNNK